MCVYLWLSLSLLPVHAHRNSTSFTHTHTHTHTHVHTHTHTHTHTYTHAQKRRVQRGRCKKCIYINSVTLPNYLEMGMHNNPSPRGYPLFRAAGSCVMCVCVCFECLCVFVCMCVLSDYVCVCVLQVCVLSVCGSILSKSWRAKNTTMRIVSHTQVHPISANSASIIILYAYISAHSLSLSCC